MKKWLLSAKSFKQRTQLPRAIRWHTLGLPTSNSFPAMPEDASRPCIFLGIFWQLQVTPQQSTEIPRPWCFSIKKHNWMDGREMHRGSRLQCPTKVDGWNSHDLQGDICDVAAKLMAGKVAVFSLCKHFSGPKFLLSCKFSITSSHHLLFKKKSAHFPSPEVLCHTNRRTGGFRL